MITYSLVNLHSSYNQKYMIVLSRYPISRCDTYRDTWITMRYVSRYLFMTYRVIPIDVLLPFTCSPVDADLGQQNKTATLQSEKQDYVL